MKRPIMPAWSEDYSGPSHLANQRSFLPFLMLSGIVLFIIMYKQMWNDQCVVYTVKQYRYT